MQKAILFLCEEKIERKIKDKKKGRIMPVRKKNIYIYYACEQTHKIVSKPNVSINIVGQAEA